MSISRTRLEELIRKVGADDPRVKPVRVLVDLPVYLITSLRVKIFSPDLAFEQP